MTRSALFAEARSQWAKAEAEQRYNSIEFWYRKKYSLPATDPRFLDATLDEMLADFWAHCYSDDPKLIENVAEDDEFDPDEVARRIGFDEPAPVKDGDVANVDDWEDLK